MSVSDVPRYLVNRTLVIIRHKQPFLDWLLSADPKPSTHLSLDQLEDEGDAFLIPDEPKINNEAQAVKWVEKRWKGFFEYFLNEWITDEDLWPQNRSLKMFRLWFGVEFRSMIWDMDDKTLLGIEDWGEFDEDVESDQASHLH